MGNPAWFPLPGSAEPEKRSKNLRPLEQAKVSPKPFISPFHPASPPENPPGPAHLTPEARYSYATLPRNNAWCFDGTRDVGAGKQPDSVMNLYRGLRSVDGRRVAERGFSLDSRTGFLSLGNGAAHIQLSRLIGIGPQKRVLVPYNRDSRYSAVVHGPLKAALVVDNGFPDTLFAKTFFLHGEEDGHFTLVTEEPPFFQLWKVNADSL